MRARYVGNIVPVCLRHFREWMFEDIPGLSKRSFGARSINENVPTRLTHLQAQSKKDQAKERKSLIDQIDEQKNIVVEQKSTILALRTRNIGSEIKCTESNDAKEKALQVRNFPS